MLAPPTCQVEVSEALPQRRHGEVADSLVADVQAVAQVQPGQLGGVANQEAGRRIRQVQTGQSQLCHILEPAHSALVGS